jgi:ComF family protein
MNSFIRDLLDFVYPPVCGICSSAMARSDSENLCRECRDRIAYIRPPFCSRCGRGFAHEPEYDHLCGDCITRDPCFRRARSVGRYRGVLRNALHCFKYRLQRRLAGTLGGLMTDRMPELAGEWRHDLIVPVPLHPRRLRSRGFNQSLCLAAVMARQLRAPLDRFNLRRVRWTASQVGLTAHERAANVRGAFAVARPEALRDKCVLLIDDIYTSGSTVNECSRVILRAGAQAVDVLTLARVA